MLLGIEDFAGKDFHSLPSPNRLERFWSNDGKSKSTINVYFKYLKAILNQARMDGVIKEANFPFGRGRFEMPSAEGRKLALTLEQRGFLISKARLCKLTANGEIPFRKYGNKLLFSRKELFSWADYLARRVNDKSDAALTIAKSANCKLRNYGK